MVGFRTLADALYRAMTGRSPKSEGKTTQAKAQTLVKKHGSIAAAAKAAGVSRGTMSAWANGKREAKNTRRAKNADKLATAERQARMTKAGTKRIQKATGHPIGSGGGLRIRATVQISQDRRPDRVIKPGENLPPGALDEVVNIFATEGPEAAALHLQDVLNVHYFHGARGHIEEITDIAW